MDVRILVAMSAAPTYQTIKGTCRARDQPFPARVENIINLVAWRALAIRRAAI